MNGRIENNSMYSVEDFGRLMRVSKCTVNRLLHSGKINGKRVGKSWKISTAEIDRLKQGR